MKRGVGEVRPIELLPCSKSCSEASKEGWSSKRVSSSCSLEVAMVLALAPPSAAAVRKLGITASVAWLWVVADVDDVEVGKGQGREGDEGARGNGDGDKGNVKAVLDGEDGHDPRRGLEMPERNARDP